MMSTLHRAITLDVLDIEGILDSIDALALAVWHLPDGEPIASYVLGFSQELRAKHELPDGPDFAGHDLSVPTKRPSQSGPGTREWAEEQVRLCGKSRRAISLRRVNALLKANGFPTVTS